MLRDEGEREGAATGNRREMGGMPHTEMTSVFMSLTHMPSVGMTVW